MNGQVTVALGAREYSLVPQPHAIILRKLPELVKGASDLEGVEMDGYDEIITLLGDKVYEAIKIFIPDIMPKHEFAGYATKAAYEYDNRPPEQWGEGETVEFDEDFAVEHAPTLPQIFDAFDAGFTVNGGKRLKDLLGNVLGPEITRAVRSYVVARMKIGLSQMSVNSLSPNDGSQTLTTSGQSDQTPEDLKEQEKEASPSPAFLT